jgi:TolB protein
MRTLQPLSPLGVLVLWSVFALGTSMQALAGEQEDRYLSNVQQITDDFTKAGEGYFSPDGTQIVFQAVPIEYPFYQIYTQPLDGSPELISTGRGRTTCAYFHPDGETILFASSHLDPNLGATESEERAKQEVERQSGKRRRYSWAFDPYMDIYQRHSNGQLTPLTTSVGYDAECAYSPDGKQIVFCSDRDGDADLYIMRADGSGLRQLTDQPGYDGGPFFSPDGRWIIYRTDRKKPHHLQIHAIRTDGKHDTALTDNLGVNWAPYWHPTEPYIIWCGADHSNPKARPNYDLYLMPYTIEKTENGEKFIGEKAVRITDHPSADVLPVFSPDGKKLMWTSNRGEGGSSQLWIGDFRLPKP